MMIGRALRRPRGVALAFGALGASVMVAFNLLPVERLREYPFWLVLVPIGLWILLPALYTAIQRFPLTTCAERPLLAPLYVKTPVDVGS
jgi:hypothetical protein